MTRAASSILLPPETRIINENTIIIIYADWSRVWDKFHKINKYFTFRWRGI